MTDWLDPEQVKAWCEQYMFQSGAHSPAVAVLNALAELPEPDKRKCRCDYNDVCRFCRDKWDELQNLWRIARIICGKDATP